MSTRIWHSPDHPGRITFSVDAPADGEADVLTALTFLLKDVMTTTDDPVTEHAMSEALIALDFVVRTAHGVYAANDNPSDHEVGDAITLARLKRMAAFEG